MQTYHVFQMEQAQNGLGIVPHNSPLVKKIGIKKSLFQGTFEEASAKKKEFIDKPWTLNEVINNKEKEEQKNINKLLKKHM